VNRWDRARPLTVEAVSPAALDTTGLDRTALDSSAPDRTAPNSAAADTAGLTITATLADRLAEVRTRLDAAAAAAGRNPGDVRLLLATKTQPVKRIREALRAGFTLIGENRAQEVVAKADELADLPHRTHFIGHLQTNKITAVLPHLDCLQTLDTAELAERLQRRLDADDRTLDVLLQVNVSGEASKSGVDPADLDELARAVARFDRLRVRGLMTIGRQTDDEAVVRAGFAELRQCLHRLRAGGGGAAELLTELSMGMSGDAEPAIAEGATIVRLGAAVFGGPLMTDQEEQTGPEGGGPPEGVRDFLGSYRRFLDWVQSGTADERNEVTALCTRVLGPQGTSRSVVSRELATFEQVNLQTALNAWSDEPGRTVQVHGIAVPPHWGGMTLQQLIHGDGLPPLRLSAPALIDLPDGPGSTLACLKSALLEVTDEHGRYLMLVKSPNEHDNTLMVEIAGLPVATAQARHAEIDRLRAALNVYRGHLLDVSITNMGGVTLAFAELPVTRRDDVILPGPVLERVERHALGVAAKREALRALGQHLKRGVLLYGPPGTGKTHTTRYLVGRMTDYTRLLLTGRSLHAIGAVTELARDLQPAVVVLEDVDLVAEDRSYGHGSSSVLFDLLDAMDGAAGDADLLFLLTTNRADLLETALAARPGRVDVAVEIDLPDGDARGRLLDLYGRSLPMRLEPAERDAVIERTAGVTASFLKELIRRAVLEALSEQDPLTELTADHLDRALTDLLDAGQQLTRSLLGVGAANDDPTPPADPGPPPRGRPRPGRAGMGSAWTDYTPLVRGGP